MKKKLWSYIILLIVAIIGISAFFIYKFSSSKINSNYSANKINSEEKNEINNTNSSNNDNSEMTKNYNNIENSKTNEAQNSNSGNLNDVNSNSVFSMQGDLNQTQNATSDLKSFDNTNLNGELLSTFSTKIYTKDSGRQNNIALTCNTLNNTIVKNSSTFSFCDTLGPSTTSQGYKKADVFDKNGNIQKGLGGGKCQVSSTLYNAVLKVSNLVVTERHKHSNKVPYVKEGKDAAVSYRKL